MSHEQQIAKQLNLRPKQVTATIELLDADNTLPFIARYRKEVTGGLDEEQLRQLKDLLTKLRALDERRQTIISTIEAQGALTPELHQQLLTAENRTTLEDLYQPYKPKRRTRATLARQRGLEPLSQRIRSLSGEGDPLSEARAYVDPEKQVPDEEAALAGARDIVAEWISENAWGRTAAPRRRPTTSSASPGR